MHAGWLVWITLGAAAGGAPARAEKPPVAPAVELKLDVLLVNDPDFPPVTEDQAQVILKQTRATLADKLDFPNIQFVVRGQTSVSKFMARHRGDGSCLEQFEPSRVRPGGRAAREADPKAVDKFLNRWSVASLAAFFPKYRRKGLTSYAAIRERLLAEFDRKIEMIADFKLKNGRSLLSPEQLDNRSYVAWICAVREQDEADLILTNAFILYDLAEEPYPHSIFAKCKMGGASLLSPKRRAIYRRALVASTFSMVTDLPFFQEEGVDFLTTREKLGVIGAFIVAHELGHALFKIPDFYDHPPQCLMTTKYETGYVDGYRDLLAHPGPCPACAPYVAAKRHVFLAETARAQGKHEEVITQLKKAIKETPKHVDGSYLRYVADLSVGIAQAHLALGNQKKARQWIRSVLRVVPKHELALKLKTELSKTPPRNPSSPQPGATAPPN